MAWADDTSSMVVRNCEAFGREVTVTRRVRGAIDLSVGGTSKRTYTEPASWTGKAARRRDLSDRFGSGGGGGGRSITRIYRVPKSPLGFMPDTDDVVIDSGVTARIVHVEEVCSGTGLDLTVELDA